MSSAIAERVAAARERIASAAARAGRDAADVAIVGAKPPDAHAARAAVEAGVIDLGENRVAALAEITGSVPEGRWHMIGRVQTNKVRRLPDGLHALHSVDRPSLVTALARRYPERSLRPRLFVEVNVAGETQKGGVAPVDLASLLDGMTIAPWSPDPEAARSVFAELAALAAGHGLPHLSMGMTDDFEVAVEEGATVVRLGRVLFGDRPS